MRYMHVLDINFTRGLLAEEDLDSNDRYYRFWLYSPKRRDSVFDDSLVAALILICPEAAPYYDSTSDLDRRAAGPSLPVIISLPRGKSTDIELSNIQ